MIVLVEGLNGVGKTTYVRALSKKLGISPYRPFRKNLGEHWDESGGRLEKDFLEALRIPVNNHVEEMYIADFARSVGVSFIQDRTMLSSLAYGRVENQSEGWYNEGDNAQALFELWESIYREADGVLLLYLTAPFETAKQRAGARALTKEKWKKLDAQYDKMFRRSTLPKKQINTDAVDVETGVNLVCRLLKS
jgi:thymidylate kinase